MKTIGEWVYSTLAEDSTLLGYTGGSASNPRVYYHFPPIETKDIIGTTGGAITYYCSGSIPLSGDVVWALAIPDEIYSIDIYSRLLSVIENCFTQIDTLFSEQLQASITGWKVQRIYRSSHLDLPKEVFVKIPSSVPFKPTLPPIPAIGFTISPIFFMTKNFLKYD